MFETSKKIIQKNLTYFLIIIFVFYIFSPYLLYLFNNLFLENVLSNFPIESHEKDREYVKSILEDTNFHLIFILNTILFFIFSYFFLKLISFQNQETKNNFYHKKFLIFLNYLLFICILLLIVDFYELFSYLSTQSDITHRSSTFSFINERKQTHIVLGIIFSLYLIKHKKYTVSSIFLFLIVCFEIYTLSRFYIFLFSVALIILSKRKYSVLLSLIILIIVTYRLFLLGTYEAFFNNLFWEPISLWCSEIIKLQNLLLNIEDPNFKKSFFYNNIFANPLFLNPNDLFYIFKENTFSQFGSYANMGIIEIIAFPYQALILTVIALIIKNKLDKIFYLNDFFIILSCFCIFKILRGSAIYGISFFVKTEILIGSIIILIYFSKKLNFFKSSS